MTPAGEWLSTSSGLAYGWVKARATKEVIEATRLEQVSLGGVWRVVERAIYMGSCGSQRVDDAHLRPKRRGTQMGPTEKPMLELSRRVIPGPGPRPRPIRGREGRAKDGEGKGGGQKMEGEGEAPEIRMRGRRWAISPFAGRGSPGHWSLGWLGIRNAKGRCTWNANAGSCKRAGRACYGTCANGMVSVVGERAACDIIIIISRAGGCAGEVGGCLILIGEGLMGWDARRGKERQGHGRCRIHFHFYFHSLTSLLPKKNASSLAPRLVDSTAPQQCSAV